MLNALSIEMKALKRTIIRYALVLFFVFAGLLIFTPESFGLSSAPALSASFATNAFLLMQEALVPEGVPVVTLGPVAPFAAPIVVAFLLALLGTFPFGLFLGARFLSPALLPAERRTLFWYTVPTLLLFYIGAAFAYFFIIPQTFSLLYAFAAPVNVVPMFSLDQFLSTTFLIIMVTGAAFLLPVVMVLFGHIGLIPPTFWMRHWRGATFFVILFSAVITPDGSGVTMAFLSAPLLGLYAIGTVSSAVSARRA